MKLALANVLTLHATAAFVVPTGSSCLPRVLHLSARSHTPRRVNTVYVSAVEDHMRRARGKVLDEHGCYPLDSNKIDCDSCELNEEFTEYYGEEIWMCVPSDGHQAPRPARHRRNIQMQIHPLGPRVPHAEVPSELGCYPLDANKDACDACELNQEFTDYYGEDIWMCAPMGYDSSGYFPG